MSVTGQIRHFLGLVGVMTLGLALSGCKTASHEPRQFDPRPDGAPVMADQVDKDVRVVEAADRIDQVAATAPDVQPAIKVETQAIRTAVATAPAEDVNALIATFEGQLDARESEINRLLGQIEKLQDQELRWQARGLTGLGIALVLAFGVSVAFGGGLMAAAKTWPIAVMGVGCLGLAQIVSHPWFMPTMAGLLALGFGYVIYYCYDKHRDGKLKTMIQRKAAVLDKVVPVLDHARKHASKTMREVLDGGVFGQLSNLMSDDEKAVVKQVRREVDATGVGR